MFRLFAVLIADPKSEVFRSGPLFVINFTIEPMLQFFKIMFVLILKLQCCNSDEGNLKQIHHTR